MFPKQVQLMFNAQTALQAAQQQDPRFDALVTKLMERTGLDKEGVLRNIVLLAQGSIF